MAKKQGATADTTGAEIVEELHVADAGVEYTEVVGNDDLPEGVEDPEKQPVAEPAKKPAKPAAAEPAAGDGEEIPEDLKGKSPAQLAKMVRDAQSLIGRQGHELGELRRAADTYIKRQLEGGPAAPKPAAAADPAPAKAPDAVDFFADPTTAVANAIANHPALKKLEGAAKEFATREITRQRAESERQFQTAHPDAATVLADEKFREWILKSPIRQQMLVRAHRHYDLQAANEVFNTWKELQAVQKPTPAAGEAKPQKKPVAGKEAARVPTGGNATPQGGEPAKKIYRRADVIRLMENDPERYALMADEITRAYSEGRVR